MPDPTTNDIDALLAQLMKARDDDGWFITGDQAKDFSRALTGLVAERDALREGNLSLVAERAALRKRVDTLELQSARWRDPHPPADRDRELRERLVCAALTGVMAGNYGSEYESAAIYAIRHADAVLAAMRKEGGGA
jgi:hypothetical protein